MKILIIGATRGIGLQLLIQALERGHTVTALVRNPGQLTLQDPGLTVVKGDIRDAQSVTVAMDDQDGVCCCIGIRPTFKPVSVFSEGIKNVLAAMQEKGVRFLINITGIGAGDSKGHGGFLYDRIFNPLLLGQMYKDKDRQEALIKSSDFDWVIVRPGLLTNGPLRGEYRVVTDLTGVRVRTISRADVAHFMLEELVARKYIGKTPLLTY